jgi:mycofactocin precursor
LIASPRDVKLKKYSSRGVEIPCGAVFAAEELVMAEPTTIAQARTADREPESGTAPDAEPRAEELLIEEISIDGMCGVY